MALTVRAEHGASPAPATPNGAADAYDTAATTALAGAANGTGQQPSYNSDVRPVAVGRDVNVSHISHTPDTAGDRGYDPRNYSVGVTTVYEGRNLLNYWRSQRVHGDPTYDNLVGLMRATGFLGARANSMTSIEDAWTNVLQDAASSFNPAAPHQSEAFAYLNSLLAENGDQTDGSGSGSGSGPKIDSQINLTDPGTAATLADQALMQYLGRRASDKEQKAFRKALLAAEMQNPDRADVVGTTQINSGGFNPATFADEWAQGKQGAGEYQAVTTFLDTFLSSLDNKTEVVK